MNPVQCPACDAGAGSAVFRSLLRPVGRGLATAVVLVAAASAQAAPPLARSASASSAAEASAPVRAILVELRDAPTHATLMRDRADRAVRAAAGRSDGTTSVSLRESTRWQGVLTSEPGLRVSERRAVGVRAQRLLLERPLSRDEARAVATRLAARADVAWAEPAVRERRLQVAPQAPTDPYFGGFGGQWWLQPVQGSQAVPLQQRLRGVPGFLTAWVQSDAGSAVSRVAVLDNGITAHSELAGRVLPGYDFVADTAFSNDGDGRDGDPSDPGDWVDEADRTGNPASYSNCVPQESSWHGTAIAGMLFANTDNGTGVAAMNWRGSVVPVRVAAKCGADVADIVDGMRWAAGLADVCKRSDTAGNCVELAPRNANPVRVINISFGGTGTCTPYQAAIDELRALGVVVVAAAGNEFGTPTRPAKCPGVVGVVALNRDGFKSNYSNFGAELAASGLATVGGDDSDGAWASLADSGLLSIGNLGDTVPGAEAYFSYFGTSFAAPVVAGAVSLMLSVNPALTHAQIVDGLRRSARPHVLSSINGVEPCSSVNPGRCLCTTQTCGAGILDIRQALAYAADPAAYVAPATGAAIIDSPELQAAAALGPDRVGSPPPAPSGSSGGGAASGGWLAALALVSLVLLRVGQPRRTGRR
jgi:serine protease